MDTVSNKLLMQQWQTLHNSHESYENYALIIKLIATIMVLLIFVFSINTVIALVLLTILWLQEAIWKTLQKRTEDSILSVEEQLTDHDSEGASETNGAYMLYTQWQENRPSTNSLVTEYIKSSLRPTVLYPYFPLMLAVVIF